MIIREEGTSLIFIAGGTYLEGLKKKTSPNSNVTLQKFLHFFKCEFLV